MRIGDEKNLMKKFKNDRKGSQDIKLGTNKMEIVPA